MTNLIGPVASGVRDGYWVELYHEYNDEQDDRMVEKKYKINIETGLFEEVLDDKQPPCNLLYKIG